MREIPRTTIVHPDLVLHAAAWTNVDGAEDDPQSAAEVNVGGPPTRRSSEHPSLRIDGLRLRRPQGAPYVESEARARSRRTGGRSSMARARPGNAPGSSGVPGSTVPPGTTSCGRCSGSARSATRSRSSTTSAAARPTSGTSRPPPASSSPGRRRSASGISPPAATALGPISRRRLRRGRGLLPREADRDGRVRRPGPAPAVSILRSEKGAPDLPHLACRVSPSASASWRALASHRQPRAARAVLRARPRAPRLGTLLEPPPRRAGGEGLPIRVAGKLLVASRGASGKLYSNGRAFGAGSEQPARVVGRRRQALGGRQRPHELRDGLPLARS